MGTAYALKQFVRERRPDKSDFESFPSDTSALAFAPAQYLWDRYGWQYGVPAYLAAGFVGFSRIDAKKHHWYDVAASAGIAFTFSKTTPALSLNYHWTDAVMLYAKYVEGYTSGGFDPVSGPATAAQFSKGFEPESIKSYELGLKGEFLDRRLRTLGSHYGALPAHAGLWEAAAATADDPLARLAIVPMVLEARGLDVTPATVTRFRAQGDEASAKILERIYTDEIRHVSAGTVWFNWMCDELGFAPAPTWQTLVKSRFRGVLKPPFNDSARRDAGLTQEYYAVIAS